MLSWGQSVVLGKSTTTYLPLLVLPSDGEVTMVIVGVGDGTTLVPVEHRQVMDKYIFVAGRELSSMSNPAV